MDLYLSLLTSVTNLFHCRLLTPAQTVGCFLRVVTLIDNLKSQLSEDILQASLITIRYHQAGQHTYLLTVPIVISIPLVYDIT